MEQEKLKVYEAKINQILLDSRKYCLEEVEQSSIRGLLEVLERRKNKQENIKEQTFPNINKGIESEPLRKQSDQQQRKSYQQQSDQQSYTINQFQNLTMNLIPNPLKTPMQQYEAIPIQFDQGKSANISQNNQMPQHLVNQTILNPLPTVSQVPIPIENRNNFINNIPATAPVAITTALIPPPPQQQVVPPIQISSHVVSQQSQLNPPQLQNTIIDQMLKLYGILNVNQSIYDEQTREIYKSIMSVRRTERSQTNSQKLISDMFFDTYLPLINLLNAHPQKYSSLACIFVEEHIDFLITTKKGLDRKQIKKDKMVFAFVVVMKFLKSQNSQGQFIYYAFLSILTNKLSFLFRQQQSPNPSDLMRHQKYFATIFYERSPIPQNIPPPEDDYMRYVSMVRKLCILLWGLLWIDPSICLTNEIVNTIMQFKGQNERIFQYSQKDLEIDRSIFTQYIKEFIQRFKMGAIFTDVPCLSSLWDVMSYTIYKSQASPLPQQLLMNEKNILKSIFEQCDPVLQTLRQSHPLQMTSQRNVNTLESILKVRELHPEVLQDIIINIHRELFEMSFQNQQGMVAIVKFKSDIIKGIVDQRSEDYQDYDFFKKLFLVEASEDFYTQ